MATWITLQPPNSSYLRLIPLSSPSPVSSPSRRRFFKLSRCVPLQQQEQQLEQLSQILITKQKFQVIKLKMYYKNRLRIHDYLKGDNEALILCEECNGKGWLLCDFCKGQKTNVKSENKRIYRRCPSCKAVGFVLCRKCKVFKCVTFPNSEDGDELMF